MSRNWPLPLRLCLGLDYLQPHTSQQLPKPHVLKHGDGDPTRSISNNMTMHRCLLNSTQFTRLPLLVPHSYKMLQAHDLWYQTSFPAGRGEPCETYPQERIHPLPLSIRSTLIDLYCAPSKQDIIRNSKKDEDCLMRLHCGKRRRERDRARPTAFFSPRNYELHIDQMSSKPTLTSSTSC